MQYLLLIHDDPADYYDGLYEEYGAYTEALQASGALVGANQLQPVDTATTVRVRNDETLVTDGPFIETKEALGGYYLVEAADLDAAIAIAKDIPMPFGGVEVRPVQVY